MIETHAKVGLWINGAVTEAVCGDHYLAVNPYSGEVAAEAAKAGKADTKKAIAAAADALPAWARMTGNARANILYKAYRKVRENKDELVRLLVEDHGKTVKEASKEIRSTGAFIRFCAEEARRIYGELVPSPDPAKRVVVVKQPVGVVAAYTAANASGVIFGRKVAPALAAGCTVVLKPAEEGVRLPLALARLLGEAGLPPGVLNVVMGDAPAISEAVMEDPRVRLVSFTGSAALGRRLMRQAADGLKRMILELGGVAPFLVFEDADLDLAVEGLVAAKFRHAGQICASPQRIFAHEPIADDFLARLTKRVEAIQVGDPGSESSDYGPLQHERILEKIESQVRDAVEKGARLVCGGERIGDLLYAPTILEGVDESMEISLEEAFGPVIAVERFDEESSVIARANATLYGLGGYAYTNDLSRAWRLAEALEVGVVGINDPFPATIEGPFGGVKQSGFGLEGGRYGIEEFLTHKQVSFGV
jgi:succinate-semialdehyde dehydrogenase / glutarate-semialdehyde dehydrogenase